MINTKKSRRSTVALSVLAALILCSFATIYAFAANINPPEAVITGENEIYDKAVLNASMKQAVAPPVIGPAETPPQVIALPLTMPDTQQQPTDNTTAGYAKSAALSKVGGGTVVRVETHNPPHGGTEYKVIIVYGDYKYCVHVNASGNNVTDIHSDQITSIGPNVGDTSGSISADKAKSIAVEKAGGGVVTECKLEYKPREGITIYHIHVANGQYEYCIELEAATGSVLKSETRYKP